MIQNMRRNRRMEWKQIRRKVKRNETEHEEEKKYGIETNSKEKDEG